MLNALILKKISPLFAIAALSLLVLLPVYSEENPEQSESVNVADLVRSLAQRQRGLNSFSFAEVIQATTGNHIIPVNAGADKKTLKIISRCISRALRNCNDPNNPIHKTKRINEASSFVESALIEQLNTVEGWSAGIPKTKDGDEQRSGYPDIRLSLPDGKIFYLDPKLFAPDSKNSSFRTFYYEPKIETNKVNEDATHLLVGIQHNGKVGKELHLETWELVDLSKLLIQLKAEFQASNRDLYKDENIVSSGKPAP
ncbi:MAG: hypothetical protein ACK5NG_09395 [Chthoniobacterales bacterium]